MSWKNIWKIFSKIQSVNFPTVNNKPNAKIAKIEAWKSWRKRDCASYWRKHGAINMVARAWLFNYGYANMLAPRCWHLNLRFGNVAQRRWAQMPLKYGAPRAHNAKSSKHKNVHVLLLLMIYVNKNYTTNVDYGIYSIKISLSLNTIFICKVR